MTIDEAIAEIRTGWTIPIRSIPELRRILETLIASEENTICGKRTWPYTETNVCVLEPHPDNSNHQDAKGRHFGVGGYRKEQPTHTCTKLTVHGAHMVAASDGIGSRRCPGVAGP